MLITVMLIIALTVVMLAGCAALDHLFAPRH